MTQETCLLMTTKDDRCLLTNEKHLDTLTEFYKTFSIEVFLVELKEKAKILNLKNLAIAFCDQNQNYNVKHKKIKKIFPKENKKSRQSILNNAAKIEKFIKNRFHSGEDLSLKELKDKYKNCNLTDACLCQHMTRIRKSLTRQGHQFRKTGAGVYRMEL